MMVPAPFRLSFAVTLLAASAPAQTTWYVDAGGTPPGSGTLADPYTSIQFAIHQPATQIGDIVLVDDGTYVENVTLDGKAVLLRSRNGPLATTIQASGPGPVLLLDAPAGGASTSTEVVGFTIAGGQGSAPGVFVPSATQAFAALRRCIVRDNGGPGVHVEYDVWIFESTLVGNERGLLSDSVGAVIMRNSILWGNQLPMQLNPAFHFITHTLLQSGFGCSGCLPDDPLFWDQDGRDLHLRPDSPAIDAGDPGDPHDPDGSIVDLGALTFDAGYAPGTATSCAGTNALCPCGNGGTGGAGCDIAQGTGGVAIAVRNFLPDGAGGGTVEVLGTGYPPASLPGVTLIRSPGAEDPPVVFGDGLRCISAAGLVRVRATLAQGGSAFLPVMHGAGSGTFHYQLWNRNTPVMFCDPTAAFNLSSALEIAWP